ncbi:MAG: alpha-glucosidase C-terminal domain-containing protein [Bacteroidales bacterium]|nr:alpha-glucosidase C-terminal domain-containing protein [Bacteroidales bacterium]
MKNTRSLFIISILSMGLFMAACSGGERDRSQLTDERAFENPEWSKDAVLYELNVRQFSEEGTFSAVESRVDELAALGVDVIWFMPIHPIGEVNRKGTLGSYYSIKDFRDVNPEFGTLDDFRSLVDRIHQAGMYVMMDWVPNHSSWDNRLAEEHPDWYVRDESGGFVSPYDWTDVIQFDWSSEGLQDYMADALVYWVEDIDVDGFRVDHPHVTPADFWLRVRLEMEKVKPVLMLAENEDRVEFFQNGYDINYSWELHHLMNQVAQGKDTADVLHQALMRDQERFPDHAYRLRFITNHDENSWAGTIEERLGEAHEAMAVFMYTIPGMPLLYNGQEAGLNKRLEFFERDPIEWHESYLRDFYTSLNRLKKENPALHNGKWGGDFNAYSVTGDDDVYVYARTKDDNRVVTIINFDDEAAEFSLDADVAGDYSDYFSGETMSISGDGVLVLDGWGYMVLVGRE